MGTFDACGRSGTDTIRGSDSLNVRSRGRGRHSCCQRYSGRGRRHVGLLNAMVHLVSAKVSQISNLQATHRLVVVATVKIVVEAVTGITDVARRLPHV